ncbi:unnamed protein product [Notodromas monacha]|uniref:Proline-rich transmembrane protein 3/4 domain-containing protein n=1 Tax=Notodromas monacha TaxID=399045 RepID=A0A7R9GA80_9CRUS|nr:unnamed protein product [Notodromas monacha]CAG0915069.1 unnamed protein product [Notodromas monacha]
MKIGCVMMSLADFRNASADSADDIYEGQGTKSVCLQIKQHGCHSTLSATTTALFGVDLVCKGIPDQKHQRRTGFGPRVSHFAGVDDGVQHHLETKVAAVFNKVAFRNPSTTTTTTTKTTSSRSVIDTNYSLPSHIIVDITPTAAPSSSVSEMFAFSRQNITGLVTTTPRRLNGSVPTGDPAKKRNRNKPKKQKPFVIAVGVATESPTLEKLGDNSRQILFGSSTPRSSSFSSTTIAAAAKKTTTPPTTTTTTTTSTTTTTETPTTATAKKSVMQLTPDQITPNDSSFLPDDLLLVKNSTTEFPKELFSRLDSAWDAHVYTFMALFLLLAFLCVVFAARLASKQPTALSKGYNVSMLIFVTTLAVTQSVSLFAEFYGAQVFKPELIPAMATLSLPCLTSSFAVLFLALLDATRLQIMSPYVQNPVSMAGVIVLHFLLSVSSVMTLGDSMMGKFVFLLGQIVFVTWALGLAFGYLYGSRAMVRMARTLRLQEAIAGGDGKYAPNLLGPIRVGFLVGALVSLTAIVVVYTMVLSVLDKQQHHHHQHQQHDGSTTTRNSPWPWWPTHIVLRSVEVVFGFLVLFVARMPRRFDSGGHHHHHHQQHLSGTASKSHHQHPSSSCRNTLSTCLSSWRRAHRYRNGVSDVTAVWQTHNRGVVGSGRDDDDDDDETEDLYPTYCNSNQAVKNFERTNGRPVYSDALTVGNLHTSQTSPIVVTADNLSSRNSSVFDIDKHVSACSSESAAASSFDVHMFLDETMSHEEEEEEEDDVFPECDIPEPVLDSEMFLQHQATSLSSPSYNSLPSLEVASLMALQDRLGGGYAAENCNKNNVRKNNNARLAAPPTSFRTRRHLSAAAAAAVGGDGAYHPSAYAANNSSRQQFVAAARHSRGTWCDDSFDVPVVSNGFHQDLVLSPRQRQQHQLLSSACNYDSSADSGKSLELLDSVNRDCEDYGESDVDVNPNILKARILKVCDNIRQFSDQPALNQSSSVESAF